MRCSLELLVPPALFALVAVFSAPATAGEIIFLDSSGNSEAVDPMNPGRHAMPSRLLPRTTLGRANLTWNITYQDIISNTDQGFDHPTEGPARCAVAYAVLSYIDYVLNFELNLASSAVIDVHFDLSEMDGTGALATGGTYFFSSPPGFTGGFCFDHIVTGTDPSGSLMDIFCTVDFGYPWYTGGSSPLPSQVDFFSVLLHEMTHGLGFLSLAGADGSSQIGAGVYTFYDDGLYTGTGTDLFSWNGSTVVFNGNSVSLLGGQNGVFYRGANASAAYGSYPPIHAPSSWQPGSSISHWAPAIVGGAVMTPGIYYGTVNRTYAPVEYGALADIGYAGQTNSIIVDVTPNTASWTMSGPAGFEGNGQTHTGDRTFTNAPAGSYTWAGLSLAGYETPPGETQTLSTGTITFTKTWTAAPQTGTVVVDVTPSTASWTMSGPAGFGGNGQTYTGGRTFVDAPAGSYTWTGLSLAGYTTPVSQTQSLAGGTTIYFMKTWVLIPKAATPTFSPVPGTYAGALSVTISTTTDGATIYYTINGGTPDTGDLAQQPVQLAAPTGSSNAGGCSPGTTGETERSYTVRARAFKDEWTPSDTAEATYVLRAAGKSGFIETTGGERPAPSRQAAEGIRRPGSSVLDMDQAAVLPIRAVLPYPADAALFAGAALAMWTGCRVRSRRRPKR